MAAALAHVERGARRDAVAAVERAAAGRAVERTKAAALLKAEGGAAAVLQAATRTRSARLDRERRDALEAEAAATAATMDAAAVVLQQAARSALPRPDFWSSIWSSTSDLLADALHGAKGALGLHEGAPKADAAGVAAGAPGVAAGAPGVAAGAAGVAAGAAGVATGEEERRRDASDGQWYTRAEFVAEYGGTTEWEESAVPVPVPPTAGVGGSSPAGGAPGGTVAAGGAANGTAPTAVPPAGGADGTAGGNRLGGVSAVSEPVRACQCGVPVRRTRQFGHASAAAAYAASPAEDAAAIAASQVLSPRSYAKAAVASAKMGNLSRAEATAAAAAAAQVRASRPRAALAPDPAPTPPLAQAPVPAPEPEPAPAPAPGYIIRLAFHDGGERIDGDDAAGEPDGHPDI